MMQIETHYPGANASVAPPRDRSHRLIAQDLHKTFVLHNQGGIRLPVLAGISLSVKPGECVALAGISGSGKSTFLRSLYGNYRIDQGAIWLLHNNQWVNLPQLVPHELIEVRKTTIGYVSQFLRVIPRVPALTIAAEPLMELGQSQAEAEAVIKSLFEQLNLPARLWDLSPTTFSGGEKQRINIARAFSVNYPILLLDEPTASLDATNREVVIKLIEDRKSQGCALIGIFHDDEVRSRVCNRILTFTPLSHA